MSPPPIKSISVVAAPRVDSPVPVVVAANKPLERAGKDILLYNIIQLCSGIIRGRMLDGEPFAQRFQKLIYLHLFTDCFMTISPQS